MDGTASIFPGSPLYCVKPRDLSIVPKSFFNASVGSIRIARVAGITHATSVTRRNGCGGNTGTQQIGRFDGNGEVTAARRDGQRDNAIPVFVILRLVIVLTSYMTPGL